MSLFESYIVFVVALIVLVAITTAICVYGWMLEKEVKRLKQELEQERRKEKRA